LPGRSAPDELLEQVGELQTHGVVQLTAKITAELDGDIVAAELFASRSKDFAHQTFRAIAIDGAPRAFAAGDDAEAWIMQVIRARA
jgi:hypothetical protein